MRFTESSGKTIEEAVTQGLDKLGVSLGDVTIDIIREGSKGFLGLLGGKPALVRLTIREDEKDSPLSPAAEEGKNKKAGQRTGRTAPAMGKKPRPQPKRTNQQADAPAALVADTAVKEETDPPKKAGQAQKVRTPRSKPARTEKREARETGAAAQIRESEPQAQDDAPESPQGKARQFLLKVTELMGVQVSVAASTDEEGNLRVDMHGDTLGVLIGRRGETLDALQYLTSLYVNRNRDEYVRCTLDTENYRAKREEALTRLANRMASRAVKTGRKVVMEPMNPYERRILHNALQQNEAVATHSEGDEPNRHVVITLRQG